jgi:hypothetical protein
MSLFPVPVHYRRAERKGMVALGCRTIECFRPYHFGVVGYPFSINTISELWKYTECMHDGFGIQGPIDDYIISNFLKGGFTDEEFEHIKTIVSAVKEIGELIGRPCQMPTNTLYYAINHARHIRVVAPPGSLVVELGGGAGYLGALLVLMGYRYVGTDISQAFYLLQSHLLARTAPAGCINLLDERNGVVELGGLKPYQAAQIPWWHWARPEIPRALAVDVVTSNHNILEMHPFSFLYHLSVLRERLTDSAPGFVFEAWGDPSNNPVWKAVQAFADKGFLLTHNDRRITCFTRADSSNVRQGVLRYPLDKASTDAELYATPEFSDARNPVSKAIIGMRRKELLLITHGLADYLRFLDRTNLATVDERFLAYLFRDTANARPWADVGITG